VEDQGQAQAAFDLRHFAAGDYDGEDALISDDGGLL